MITECVSCAGFTPVIHFEKEVVESFVRDGKIGFMLDCDTELANLLRAGWREVSVSCYRGDDEFDWAHPEFPGMVVTRSFYNPDYGPRGEITAMFPHCLTFILRHDLIDNDDQCSYRCQISYDLCG